MAEPREGEIVRCTVDSQQPWGVFVVIDKFPELNASIDLIGLGLGSSDRNDYPAPGQEVEAVVMERRSTPGTTEARFKLSHLPEHIAQARLTGTSQWQLGRADDEQVGDPDAGR
jgi:hypothetical protein